MTADYYRLGEKDIHFVSAEHKINIDALEEAIVAALPPGTGPPRPSEAPLRIAIVGRTNVGKSSIVNRLAGEERAHRQRDPRHDPRQHRHAPHPRREAVLPRGHGRHPPDGRRPRTAGRRPASSGPRPTSARPTSSAWSSTSRSSRRARTPASPSWPSSRAGPSSSPSTSGTSSTRTPSGRTPSGSGSSASSASSPTRRSSSSRPGRASASSRSSTRPNRSTRAATTRVETSKLNEFLARTTEAHPPRLKNGARAKLRYMTQKGVSPPTFILFLGARGPLSPTYEKYFLESLRQEFGFAGTPLRLIVRTS